MAKRKDYDANWKVWFPYIILEGRGNVKGMITQAFQFLPENMQKDILKELNNIVEQEKEKC